MVQQGLRSGDDREEAELVKGTPVRGVEAQQWGDERLEEGVVDAEIHGGANQYQAQQVEPSGRPTEAAVPEDGSPVVKATRRGESGSNLRHGQRHHEGERSADQPADAH